MSSRTSTLLAIQLALTMKYSDAASCHGCFCTFLFDSHSICFLYISACYERWFTVSVICVVKDPEESARADVMVEIGDKRARIYDFLIAQGENVLGEDIGNIVDSHRSKVATVDDDEATGAVIAKFVVEDDASSVTIDETAAGEACAIPVSSRYMRETVSRFPELCSLTARIKRTGEYACSLFLLCWCHTCTHMWPCTVHVCPCIGQV